MPATLAAQTLNRRRGCLRGLPVWLVLLGVVAVLLFITPWGLHMGGRWTPALVWHGYGKMAASNSKPDALLFLEVFPETHRGSRDNIRGTALLCTDDGEAMPFQVNGRVQAWLDADQKPMSLRLSPPKTPGLLGPSKNTANQHYSFTLYGQWQGTQLLLTDHGSFAPILAAIKSGAPYPTYTVGPKVQKIEHSVVLEYGKRAQFDAQCSGRNGASF